MCFLLTSKGFGHYNELFGDHNFIFPMYDICWKYLQGRVVFYVVGLLSKVCILHDICYNVCLNAWVGYAFKWNVKGLDGNVYSLWGWCERVKLNEIRLCFELLI